jgi:hypothetical protein
MKHDIEVNYPGGFDKLTEDLGNLRYDALAEFLTKLSEKLNKDSEADKNRGRSLLATQLAYAGKHIGNAWEICRPFMG